jgi:hypothetical protein
MLVMNRDFSSIDIPCKKSAVSYKKYLIVCNQTIHICFLDLLLYFYVFIVPIMSMQYKIV